MWCCPLHISLLEGLIILQMGIFSLSVLILRCIVLDVWIEFIDSNCCVAAIDE